MKANYNIADSPTGGDRAVYLTFDVSIVKN